MKVERQATEELDRLGGLIEGIKVGMLATIGPDGSLRARPLQTLELDRQGRLWFFTDANSPKTGEIADHEHQVCVSYADPDKQSYVSVSGTARLVRDKDRMVELWTPWIKAWFPRGVDDPNLALLEVRIDKAEYWDSPGSGAMRMVALGKALATGKRDHIGEDVKVAGPRSAAPGGE